MLQLEKDVLIYLNLFEATWGFLWKKKKKIKVILRREMSFLWFNQRPELDGKVRKSSQTTCTWRFVTLPGSLWIITERKVTFAVRAASPSWTSASGGVFHAGDTRLLRRQVMHVSRTLMNSNQWLRRSQCIYPIRPWTGGMKALCDTHCSPSIISVPIFHKDHSILQPYGGLLP